jgi:ADP-ribosylglycohydrolase
LESTDYEDAIRNAISLSGDSEHAAMQMAHMRSNRFRTLHLIVQLRK